MSIKDTIEKAVEKYLEEDKMYRKKITPTGDLSWYIKWVSSVIILFGKYVTLQFMVSFDRCCRLGCRRISMARQSIDDIEWYCIVYLCKWFNKILYGDIIWH